MERAVSVVKDGFSAYKVDDWLVTIGDGMTVSVAQRLRSTSTTIEVAPTVGAELATTNATVDTTLRGRGITGAEVRFVRPRLGLKRTLRSLEGQ